jgi:hypothetical protein
MPTFNVDPSSALAMKGAVLGLQGALTQTPVAALTAAAAFAAAASKALNASIAAKNNDYLAALTAAFNVAGQPLPPLGMLPNVIDITPLLPTQPVVPSLPVLPGITINYAADGVTPLSITF